MRSNESRSFLPFMPLSRPAARHSLMLSRSYGGRVCGDVACFWPVLTRLLSVPCLGHKNRTRGAAQGPSKPRNRQMSQPCSPRAGPRVSWRERRSRARYIRAYTEYTRRCGQHGQNELRYQQHQRRGGAQATLLEPDLNSHISRRVFRPAGSEGDRTLTLARAVSCRGRTERRDGPGSGGGVVRSFS